MLTRGEEEPFELDDAQLDELERRMAEADRGEVEPAETVLAKLRRAMNEPLAVVFQRRAAREIEAVDEWWREHRTSAPDVFAFELGAVLSAIALMPTLDLTANAERAPGVNRPC